MPVGIQSDFNSRVEEALRLDGIFAEVEEWLFEKAWDDEWKREMLRQNYVQTRILAQISANTGRLPDIAPGEIVIDPREPIAERDDPNYWVTETSITVDNESPQAENWGFSASTVVLLFDDDTSFSFLPPGGERQNVEITLEADKYSPFSISGVNGLYADRVWYSRVESASQTPSLDIIAVE